MPEYESEEAYDAFMEQVGSWASEPAEAFWSEFGEDYDTPEAAADDFEERYHGTYGSGSEAAQEIFESLYEIPDHLEFYIDWDAVWRDLQFDYSTVGNENYGPLHLFRNY